jgi:hypothetical protein
MITVIRGSLFSLFYYWKKPVKGYLGRSCQNHDFIVVIRTQCRFVLSPINHENWLLAENSRFITDPHTTEITQIPIVFLYTEAPCLRPAVSSLGACPTPAR